MRATHWMIRSCLAVGAVMMATSSVSAGDMFHHLGHTMARDHDRNEYWPEPFIYPDRDAAVRPFGVMIAKGWQVQNTLGQYHFEPGDTQLAGAGLLKVQTILGDPAPHRRTIYVQHGATPQQTARRINAVRSAASQVLPAGFPVAVYPSSIQTRPWPAENTEYTLRKFQVSQPAPKLPAAKASSF